VTVGRGGELGSPTFFTGVVPVADLGVRWTGRSGVGFGVSIFGGRDFPNEAMLVGVRLRLSRRIRSGLFEGAISAVASSAGPGGLGHGDGLGVIVGAAYYPVRSLAVVVQLDVIPTYRATTPTDPLWQSATLTRRPAISVGARVARRVARISWIGGAILGGLAIVLQE